MARHRAPGGCHCPPTSEPPVNPMPMASATANPSVTPYRGSAIPFVYAIGHRCRMDVVRWFGVRADDGRVRRHTTDNGPVVAGIYRRIGIARSGDDLDLPADRPVGRKRRFTGVAGCRRRRDAVGTVLPAGADGRYGDQGGLADDRERQPLDQRPRPRRHGGGAGVGPKVPRRQRQKPDAGRSARREPADRAIWWCGWANRPPDATNGWIHRPVEEYQAPTRLRLRGSPPPVSAPWPAPPACVPSALAESSRTGRTF